MPSRRYLSTGNSSSGSFDAVYTHVCVCVCVCVCVYAATAAEERTVCATSSRFPREAIINDRLRMYQRNAGARVSKMHARWIVFNCAVTLAKHYRISKRLRGRVRRRRRLAVRTSKTYDPPLPSLPIGPLEKPIFYGTNMPGIRASVANSASERSNNKLHPAYNVQRTVRRRAVSIKPIRSLSPANFPNRTRSLSRARTCF